MSLVGFTHSALGGEVALYNLSSVTPPFQKIKKAP